MLIDANLARVRYENTFYNFVLIFVFSAKLSAAVKLLK